jgi:hypothetical protein
MWSWSQPPKQQGGNARDAVPGALKAVAKWSVTTVLTGIIAAIVSARYQRDVQNYADLKLYTKRDTLAVVPDNSGRWYYACIVANASRYKSLDNFDVRIELVAPISDMSYVLEPDGLRLSGGHVVPERSENTAEPRVITYRGLWLRERGSSADLGHYVKGRNVPAVMVRCVVDPAGAAGLQDARYHPAPWGFGRIGRIPSWLSFVLSMLIIFSLLFGLYQLVLVVWKRKHTAHRT